MDDLAPLREHLVKLLRGGQAYDTFEEIASEWTPELRTRIPNGVEHSAWQILEHMRICLRDILDFSQNEEETYVERKWPDEYWPSTPGPADSNGWDQTVRAYLADREEMDALVRDPNRDLFSPFPWGDGQTLLREALLAADHASYHLGQLVTLRGLFG